MEGLYQWESLKTILVQAQVWIIEYVLVMANLAQLAVVGVTFLVARYTAPRIRSWIERVGTGPRLEKQVEAVTNALAPLTQSIIWVLLQLLAVAAATQAGWPYHLIEIALSLLIAWAVIRLTSALIRDPAWSRFIA